MKGKHTYLIWMLLAVFLFAAGCTREVSPGEEGLYCMEIAIDNLHPSIETKADHIRGDDLYNENIIRTVDCFFYPDGHTGEDAVFTALGRGADPVPEGDSTVYKVKVFFTDADAMAMFGNKESGTCKLYVICNAPLSYSGSGTSIDELKNKIVESDFSAQARQDSFVMPCEEPVTVTLATVDGSRSASARLRVKRIAAKVQVFLHIPETLEDEEGRSWEPVVGAGIQVMMANAVKRTKVDGDYSVQESDYVSTPYRVVQELAPEQLIPGMESFTLSHIPFYSYACAWSDLSDYATSIVFRIPWRIVGAVEYEYRSYQMSPNMFGRKFESNHYYRTFVTVSSLGGVDKGGTVIIEEGDFTVLDWMNEGTDANGQGTVPGELISYQYLVVDNPNVNIDDQETASFTYVSSSPIASIRFDDVVYLDNNDASPAHHTGSLGTFTDKSRDINVDIDEDRVTDFTVSYDFSTTGFITIRHGLSEIYSQWQFYATITNDEGCTQEISIIQNPSISLTRLSQAGDVFVNGYFGRVSGATYAVSYYPCEGAAQYGNNGAYYRYRNGNSWTYGYFDSSGQGHSLNNAPSLSGGNWEDAGEFTNGTTYQEYLYRGSQLYYHCTSQWRGGGIEDITDGYNSTNESGSYGSILGNLVSLNESIDRNFYTTLIIVSSFNDDNDYYVANSANVNYRIGDPRVKASTVYTGGTSWNTVSNFYKYLHFSGSTEEYVAWSNPGDILITSQSAADRNIIAPRFLVSSALNANSGLTFDTAVKRGATYQEAGYPAGRWRLPSEAEIAFIVARQRDGVIPNLYATGDYYWAGSGRLVYIPSSADADIQFSNSDGNIHSCRFVYDLWQWGDTPASTSVYHPNGHNTTY